jgi:type I restriction enzyme S subunit
MSDQDRFSFLPPGWVTARIEDLVLSNGVFIDGDWVETKDQDPNGDVRLIQLADIGDGKFQNRSSRFLTYEKAQELRCTFLEVGDVLIARMPEPLGRACLFPGDIMKAVTVVDVCIVRTGIGDINHHWLVWALNSPEFRKEIAALQSGVTRRRISRRNLAALFLPVPPLAEQKRIAEEIEKQFSRLDAAVRILRTVERNLGRLRMATLKAAFEGRLVPAESEMARADGREYESAAFLVQRILHERRAKWEANQLVKIREHGKEPKDNKWRENYPEPSAPDFRELPELPEGWIWCSMGQIFEVFVGATPSRAKPEYWDGDIPWVSSGEVAFNRIRNTRERITQLGLDNTSTVMHPPGTVLLGMIGEGKTRGQAAILDIPACNNQNSAAVRVSEAGLPPEYIFRYLESVYEQTRRAASGNSQPALNKTRVQEILLPLPPLSEQYRIVAEVERRISLIEELTTLGHKCFKARGHFAPENPERWLCRKARSAEPCRRIR